MTEPFRALVTGWRNWPRSHDFVIADALGFVTIVARVEERPVVVVHGKCPHGGVDLYAHEWAAKEGYDVEPHPAERGPRGQILGPARNSRMVAAGADICLAFPGPGSRGTIDCMAKAVNADIPTEVFAWSTKRAAEWAEREETWKRQGEWLEARRGVR